MVNQDHITYTALLKVVFFPSRVRFHCARLQENITALIVMYLGKTM